MTSDNVNDIEKQLISNIKQGRCDETRASSRKINSLSHENADFDSVIFNIPISAAENAKLLKYIQLRYKEKTFDNYEFKEKKSKIEEEKYDISDIQDNKELYDLYSAIESEIKKITDYGNDGFN
ncbi:hypothetical protein ENBRE01_0046 [Enteropsectra breve]|nr:hypothetical protein ENBRE01_0046 [Enteropsectra breve]